MATSELSTFQTQVLAFYREHGRHHLPWRTIPQSLSATSQAYRILVSEVMLQQTQVDRVIPYYRTFLKRFPTVSALANAPLGEVLRAWQGLGYNRRAKMLHEAAKKIMIYHNKKFPREYEQLIRLPGVGDYTAKAVRVFAFNELEVLIETNVRTVFIHHFFPRSTSVPDDKLLPLITRSVEHLGVRLKGRASPREWYAALMDYGTHLKKTHGNVSRRSAAYVKQKPLKGSNREIRGALLKTLSQKPSSYARLLKLPFESARIDAQLAALEREGFITRLRGVYRLSA